MTTMEAQATEPELVCAHAGCGVPVGEVPDPDSGKPLQYHLTPYWGSGLHEPVPVRRPS